MKTKHKRKRQQHHHHGQPPGFIPSCGMTPSFHHKTLQQWTRVTSPSSPSPPPGYRRAKTPDAFSVSLLACWSLRTDLGRHQVSGKPKGPMSAGVGPHGDDAERLHGTTLKWAFGSSLGAFV